MPLDVGCPVYIKAFTQVDDNPLEEGDTVEAYEPSVSCWTTDRNYSPSEGEVDVVEDLRTVVGRRREAADLEEFVGHVRSLPSLRMWLA